MSTRSGPYPVEVNGEEWLWEEDMYQTDLIEYGKAPAFRIWSPHGWAIEIWLKDFYQLVNANPGLLPGAVVDSINSQYRYAIENLVRP